ncbi:ricin-type beta-trefoil lectin domain protein [Streptomyces europaeiscabiei]|uniref:ricin-type beta-trefoil lectin domain protein n=1 Tax=Streptomyces europaeiscabiei TaxID=146819 RepID=UPI0029B7C7E8|nr:ricin-type beta-trefoil lectin domain protein [Streptomyces europaeiscabiei]MDX3865162.1 ricin-type beta-trefoil lectin domain protein [Streptomyces europaeiscabiei]MDX3872627.1 ricin-type beta-trefoil lectin domain protein [Streptomyces europaeiscabiei]
MPGEDFVFKYSEPMEFERSDPMEEEHAGAAPSAGELLTLHGRSVLDYAALCTEPSRGAAERLAGQAFRNIYEDAASHAAADFPWRPRLLAAVHAAAREWNADDRRSSLHPDLRDGPTGDVGRAVSGTDRGSGARSLVLRALRNLPDRAQVLLWHTVVEAEGIEAVAPLLEAEPSLLNPERARTLLRDECVRVHLDLAPDERCRRLNRLIDVHARRGSDEMMAEVRDHLDGCAYCGAAVDQLDQSPDRLPALLAEAVLGFRAADYLASRPARRAIASARARSEPAPQPADAETRPTSTGDPEQRRRRRPLLIAVGVVLCGVIAASPMALSGTEDDSEAVGSSVPGPTGSPSGSAAPSAAPGSPSASSAPGADEGLVTRLRNVRTGLCLDLRAAAEVVGAPAVTARCAESATQMWLLEEGGRLRNQAAPELCLNAEPQGTVALRPCTDPQGAEGEESGDTRYDLAADGLLTLVAEPGVAVTPVRRAEGAVILLEPVPQDRLRRSQRWTTDEGAAGVTLRER